MRSHYSVRAGRSVRQSGRAPRRTRSRSVPASSRCSPRLPPYGRGTWPAVVGRRARAAGTLGLHRLPWTAGSGHPASQVSWPSSRDRPVSPHRRSAHSRRRCTPRRRSARGPCRSRQPANFPSLSCACIRSCHTSVHVNAAVRPRQPPAALILQRQQNWCTHLTCNKSSQPGGGSPYPRTMSGALLAAVMSC